MTTFAHAYDRPSNHTPFTLKQPRVRFRPSIAGVLLSILALTLSITIPALVLKAVQPSPAVAVVEDDAQALVGLISAVQENTTGDPVSGVCDNGLFATPECEVTLTTGMDTTSVPVPFTPTDGTTLVVLSATNATSPTVGLAAEDWWVCGYSVDLLKGDTTHGPVSIYSNTTGEFSTVNGNIFDCYSGTMLNN